MGKNTKQEEQQKLVDQWNAMHQVGTPVTRYKLVDPLREPEQTRTRSEAWLMGGHTAVVKVEGVSGGVMLESVRISNEVPPPIKVDGRPPHSRQRGTMNSPPLEGVGGGKTHELKCWLRYFEAIVHGKKTFDLRYNDRDYRIGDTLILREYDNDKKEYTRRQTRVRVTDTFADFGLISGWIAISIEPLVKSELNDWMQGKPLKSCY